MLPRSLNAQLRASMLLLFVVSAGSVGFTLYELDLRKHDYVILNLSGQLHAIARTIGEQSLRYREGVDDSRYEEAIADQSKRYELIVSSLSNRLLEPELTGRSDPLTCSWDEQSIGQLNLTATTWREFRQGMEVAQLAGGSRAMADYIIANEAHLITVSGNLSGAFQSMMEGKMRLIALYDKIALGGLVMIIVVLLTLFTLTFSRPLRSTLEGINRITQGEFGFQLTVEGNNEIGQIAKAFNTLSCRLYSLFRLSERINSASTVEESLRFVFDEFRSLLPLQWVGMLTRDASGELLVLDRCYAEGKKVAAEGESFAAEGSLLIQALEQGKPLQLDDLVTVASENPQAQFASRLREAGYHSALIYPLGGKGEWSALLVFAAQESGAYNRDHLELLDNIAGQVGNSFERTVVTENLVISAISGLAKLAESRDPETGDHLLRMARYSAIIAEEMRREGPYAGKIDGDLVRDILRFAPMHDIGKVGIEDRILLKPSQLDGDERREMELHPLIGAEVLRRCDAQMKAVGHSMFQIGIEIAEAHHEKFDGSGYPHGLKGEDIPLTARIVAAADVFDALTSRRPYKEAWSVESALKVMADEAGKHFDPEVVAALMRAQAKIKDVYDKHRHV
ncbi:MAG: HD domain-containing protein [Chromatiales bacterium]|nr:HD domain-containing protein [Chromatiales bacterium]